MTQIVSLAGSWVRRSLSQRRTGITGLSKEVDICHTNQDIATKILMGT